MLRGIPVIAYRCGCLRGEAVGPGGVVLEPNEDFAERAVPIIEAWARDPARLAASADGALATADAAWTASVAAAERISRTMAEISRRRS
jgi:hypothetical protein